MSKLLLIITLTFFIGCAAPQRAVTLSELATTPELYLDSTVTFSGLVKESGFTEGRYYARTRNRLYLTITDGTRDVYGYMEGYNKGRILRAVRLAERAEEEEGQVTITGKLTGLAPWTELKFNRLQYKDESVEIMKSYLYTYPGDPHYGHRWHYP
ncbi:MAG: hypothetical protein ACE5IC_09530, partial [Candidatus Brocadiales bacterium]